MSANTHRYGFKRAWSGLHRVVRFSTVLLIGAGIAQAQEAAVLAAATTAPAAPPAVAKEESIDSTTKMIIAGGAGLDQLNKAQKITATNVKLTFNPNHTVLEIPKNTKGVVEIKPEEEFFEAEGFTRMVFEVKNLGATEIKYQLELENEGATDTAKSAFFPGRLTPGQAKNANVYFIRDKAVKDKYPEMKIFKKLRGLPGGLIFDGRNIDPAKIQTIRISVLPSAKDVKLTLASIYASQPPVPALLKDSPEKFFPFIDIYGQYIHGTWPGKVTTDADLKEATRREEKDLTAHAGPADRSDYGGWTKGPKQEATGYFRVAKVDGKWWFVDPDGYLFWSHGVTCCGYGGADTMVADRENYFTGLTGDNTPLAQSNGKSSDIYSFSKSNYIRKYGEDWANIHRETTVRRLKSWGMNTMGNWSNPDFMYMRKVPYTVSVDFESDTITWRKFPDPFNPEFRKKLQESFEKRSESFDDPWCIGYFIQNELKFSGAKKVVEDITAEPKTKYAKIALVEDLKAKFGTIAEFNRVAGTEFTDWKGILANKKNISFDSMPEVADAFFTKLCETYFSICREEQKHFAPNHLYLGCRFLQVVGPEPVAIASRYCDVVSFNIYEFNIDSRKVQGEDKPFIVGEFHFGSLDRGMFATGNRWAGDQQDRAGEYEDYINSALTNPACVGAHWFQYNSQAFTGRPADGENYQIGLLDIAGNPYPELRDAIRKVGYPLYETRTKAAK